MVKSVVVSCFPLDAAAGVVGPVVFALADDDAGACSRELIAAYLLFLTTGGCPHTRCFDRQMKKEAAATTSSVVIQRKADIAAEEGGWELSSESWKWKR
jgi:hypothetical protein